MKDIIQDKKTNKSTGPNSLPNKIIKQVKDVMSFPLSKLINKSFSKGIFPSALKITKIVQFYKQCTHVNYREYPDSLIFSMIGNMLRKSLLTTKTLLIQMIMIY